MDYPCGSLPVGRVMKEDLDTEFMSKGSGHILDRLNRKLCELMSFTLPFRLADFVRRERIALLISIKGTTKQ
jgi:hypothetical protein